MPDTDYDYTSDENTEDTEWDGSIATAAPTSRHGYATEYEQRPATVQSAQRRSTTADTLIEEAAGDDFDPILGAFVFDDEGRVTEIIGRWDDDSIEEDEDENVGQVQLALPAPMAVSYVRRGRVGDPRYARHMDPTCPALRQNDDVGADIVHRGTIAEAAHAPCRRCLRR